MEKSPLAPAAFPSLPSISGVRFATAQAGIKYQGRNDVMAAVLEPGTVVAGVFTQSATRGAPVLDCQRKLAAYPENPTSETVFIVNSGNANAFTGRQGEDTVKAVSQSAAEVFGCPETHVFISSTGVIGEPLNHKLITQVLPEMAMNLSASGAEDAATAILTTDTFPKGASATFPSQAGPITLSGIAKGSGMIAPDMATMLAYIFTDAHIEQSFLQDCLSRANLHSFNAITVDGDTSTSDSVLIGATGKTGGTKITAEHPDASAFAAALEKLMIDLAQQIVRDGEGAQKFVEIRITGAKNNADARRVGQAIANSPLVKTALAGSDPNWGRIVMAIGKSGAEADRDRLSIRFGDILIASAGAVCPDYREEDGLAYMQKSALTIGVDLDLGQGSFIGWTCDLTHGYISINADYRS